MDDFIFERNQNDTSTDERIEVSFREIRQMINDSPMFEYAPELIQLRKKVANKLIDIFSIQNDTTFSNIMLIVDNPDVIDHDMFTVGEIRNNCLLIDIPPINVEINLRSAIQNAILHQKPNFIHRLIEQHVDLGLIEPKIFSMCIESKQDDLFNTLVSTKNTFSDYQSLYLLAAYGKLSHIIKILNVYKFSQITLVETVGKMCVQAILNNHVNILKYFFTPEAFNGAPDQMFVYFINSIKYGKHIDVVKFFVESGINIRQEEYLAIKCADQMGKSDLIRYFYLLDPSIANVLTEEQLLDHGIRETNTLKQYEPMLFDSPL